MRDKLVGTPMVWIPEEVAAFAALFGVSVGYAELVIRGSSRSIRRDRGGPHWCAMLNPGFECTDREDGDA